MTPTLLRVGPFVLHFSLSLSLAFSTSRLSPPLHYVAFSLSLVLRLRCPAPSTAAACSQQSSDSLDVCFTYSHNLSLTLSPQKYCARLLVTYKPWRYHTHHIMDYNLVRNTSPNILRISKEIDSLATKS
jgi:hypothetical protein